MSVIDFPPKAPKPDLTVSMNIEVNETFGALGEVNLRLFTIGKLLEGLSHNFYNGFGHAFDSIELSDLGVQEFKEEYGFWQPAATRHGITLDVIIEHIARTADIVDAIQIASRRAEKGQPVARHAELRRRDDWESAVSLYEAAARETQATETDAETDAAASRQSELFEKLIRTRAPDLDALREKISTARAMLGEQSHGLFTQLMADIDKLN